MPGRRDMPAKTMPPGADYSGIVTQEGSIAAPPGTRDITFAVPKSVSTLMALLLGETDRRASDLMASHDTAGANTVTWLEREAAVGRSGPAFVKCRGLKFRVVKHLDTTTNQPHLHSHVLVEPTVVGLDNRTYRLDWTSFDQAMVAAPSVYMGDLHSRLIDALGVTWSNHHHESEWEILGLPDKLLLAWPDTMCYLPGIPQTVAVRRREN